MKRTRRKCLNDFRGFEGPDVSMSISLFEYGIAWKQAKKDNYLFVIGINAIEDNYNRFYYFNMSKDDFISLCNESWFDIESICDSFDATKEKFIENFPSTVFDANSYYGYENVFGSCYSEGFEIVGSEYA